MAKTETELILSSPTLESMAVAISKYYYSPCTITGEDVFNRKGKIEGVRVVPKKGRYRFERVIKIH